MNNVVNFTKMSLRNLNAIKKLAIVSSAAIIIASLLVGDSFSNIYLLLVINLMAYIFTYMIMTFEDLSNIDILVAYLPVDKKDFIKSRYLLGIFGIIFGLLVYFLIYCCKSLFLQNSMGNLYGIFELASMGIFCAVISISVIIPSNIGFSGIKGRMISMIAFMTPMFIGAGISEVIKFTGKYVASFSMTIFLISIIILFLSYKVSIIVYKRKKNV